MYHKINTHVKDTLESGMALPVMLSKNVRIASPITLTVSPLTVDEAIASGRPLPPNIPPDNPLSPSRASELSIILCGYGET